MEASAEISLYPLENSEYREIILEFIDQLKKVDGLVVETNGMSTQIFGNFDLLMSTLTENIKKVLEQETAICVIKLGKGILRLTH